MDKVYYKLQKQNKSLLLVKCDAPIKASYSQIPLTEEQYEELVYSRHFKKLENGNYSISSNSINPIERGAYNTYLQYFNKIVLSYKHTNLWEVVPSKTFTLDIPGTSKLIRSPDKSSIKIARRTIRKNGTVANDCSINVTPISDISREQFFSDCRELHPGVYVIRRRDDERIFEYWSELMNNAYNKLSEQGKK